MGLEERLWTTPGGLSGEQRQALTLLMATWHKPRVLLLDEHTAALDPKTASLILRLSQDIVQREQLTTLMVTHSMQQAVNLGDRLLMMYRGRVLRDFSSSDKRWLKPVDLQDLFEQVRRKELLDPSAAEMLT
jgi:putative ABC transport system ATP-binding protein